MNKTFKEGLKLCPNEVSKLCNKVLDKGWILIPKAILAPKKKKEKL